MQRCSESIAAIAGALAKAQAELVNPEKSLTATLRPERQGGTERSFRYARERARYHPQDPWRARDRHPSGHRHG
jgi:hypothetical protein